MPELFIAIYIANVLAFAIGPVLPDEAACRVRAMNIYQMVAKQEPPHPNIKDLSVRCEWRSNKPMIHIKGGGDADHRSHS